MTDQVALDQVPPLTEEQRAKIRAFYDEHPDGGYKHALAHAGIRATRAAAKAAIAGDDELADLPLAALKLSEGSLLKVIGDIAADGTHKDQLRAATWGLSALHGHREKSETALTGANGDAVEVTVQHDYGQLLARLEQVGLLRRGPTALVDAAAGSLLPARTDAAADGRAPS